MNTKTLLAYYRLTKPGVMYGNVLTAVAGFLLASAGYVDVQLLIGMTLGMIFLVSGACTLNNYLDRDIDIKMERTKNRPSVTGMISAKNILAYAILLSLLGVMFLYIFTNYLALTIGIIGYVTYVWLYGAWTKRTSVHGTVMGSVSGAMPIAAGYAAVSGTVDTGLIVAFLVLYLWQFPEFYSIAIYRRKEYEAAGVPVMPVVRGVGATIIRIFIYTVLYVLATISLTVLGYTGWTYFVVMLGSGLYWIKIAYQGFGAKDKDVWAKEMFRYSMVMILLLCVMLSVGPVLP